MKVQDSLQGIDGRRVSKWLWVLLAWGVAVAPSPLRAELVIEPVINFVEGTGQAPNNFGFKAFNPAPGVKFAYVAGDPRDPVLDTVHVWNDTGNSITSVWLEIIGTGTNTEDPSTIVRGAPINARFGDVDGDGKILSTIFSTVNISADGKKIQLTGGAIPPGARFTDIHLARSANPPEFAGIDSWYVPEPSLGGLTSLVGLGLMGWRRRRMLNRR